MGISFKLSKVGVRVHPAARVAGPAPTAVASEAEKAGGAGEKEGFGSEAKREDGIVGRGTDANGITISPTCSRMILPEHEVSFTFSLYDRGYLIAKSAAMDPCQPSIQDGKTLHPYDKASEKLFSAIESGRLPGDLFDEIPSKYYNGSVICEIRDYRKHASNQAPAPSAELGLPVVNKVRLQMTFENVVRDIPGLSDDSWSYRDFMEAEARIVKVLQPALCLDPTPKLDRLCQDPVPHKLNLGIGKKRRLRQNPEVVVTSNNMSHGKKVCIDRVSENIKSDEMGIAGGNAAHQVLDNIAIQNMSGGSQTFRPANLSQDAARMGILSQSGIQQTVNYPAIGNDRGAGTPVNYAGVNSSISSPQNLMTYNENVVTNGLLSVKREMPDAPLQDPKRVKTTVSVDDMQQQQQTRHQPAGLGGQDMQWKNPQLHQQLNVKGMQYAPLSGQRYPSQMMNNMQEPASFYINQPNMRYGAKQEQMDGMDKSKDTLQTMAPENSVLDQQQHQAQHLSQQAGTRNNLQNMAQWQNPRFTGEKDLKKEEMLQRRKMAAASRVPSVPMVQSPVSSKSGEISSSSMGGQFGAAVTSAVMGSQKDKFAANSNPAVGYPSVASSPSDSMHRMQQPSVAPSKRKSNSVPKTQPPVSGVGSPASVSNMHAVLNASSPSIGTAPMGDQTILERFMKIDAISQRYKLHSKNNKVDNIPQRKPIINASQEKVATVLSNCFHAEDFRDEIKPLCNSMLGGTMNTFKTRVLNFVVNNRTYQGPTKPFRIVLREKNDGTVAMQYGEPEDFDNQNSYECTLILPTKYHADLLAKQLIARMEREGHAKADDQVKLSTPPGNLSALSGILPDSTVNDVKQEGGISQQLNAAAHANMTPGAPLQQHPASRMLPSVNNQALAMQQGYMQGATMPPRSQQLDQNLIQQQQQQPPQLQQNAQAQLQQPASLPLNQMQRPQLLQTNPLSQMLGTTGSNLPMASSHMGNKAAPTSVQLQMMQQAQQQQPGQMSRKMMMGLGSTVNMGNMVNNVVGLNNIGNVMGMGNV
ncbi:hypothetical protein E2562_017745 [Oryza meyeriana var. granulata]|uniref:Transcription factor Spt20 n=1 Tax=Oryza meyeriana var. granulata TaxID=110450 RepID=A0A6G1BY17_9ORYZ|nr:hypothetical protein E2562_017745 [Oryza meyeriana var. granulata]